MDSDPTRQAVPACPAAAQDVPAIVLDTNVLLDWLLFGDPACAGLIQALHAGQVRWVANPAMRHELDVVWRRPWRNRPAPEASVWQAAWDRWAQMDETAGPAAPAPLRCSDPDDQKFIDLALVHGARWLLTRDRALLKLARRAAQLPQQLQIATPAGWRIAQRGP